MKLASVSGLCRQASRNAGKDIRSPSWYARRLEPGFKRFGQSLRKSHLVLFILVLLCSGCATVEYLAPQQGLLVAEQSLWRLCLIDDGEEMFAGLLILQQQRQGLHVVLLDSTGIKLLDGLVPARGGMVIRSALALVAKKGLPGYLNSSLQKIFFTGVEPGDCRGSWLSKVCENGLTDDRRRKIAKFGPFALWSVSYFIKNDTDGQIEKIEYKTSGPGPDMVLETATMVFG